MIEETTHVKVFDTRHSMCKACWNKRWRKKSALGHQIPTAARHRELCCFCLQTHDDGIRIIRKSNNRELKCGGQCAISKAEANWKAEALKNLRASQALG